MEQLVLWLNMISFALMIAAVGLLYLVHARSPRAWLLAFMLYTASYAAWLLFGTYAYVQALFLPNSLPALPQIFAYVRAVASFFVLGAGSSFYLGIAINPWRSQAHWITAAAALVVAVAMAAYFIFGVVPAARAATLVFNGYLCALSVVALKRSRSAKGALRRVVPFLAFSATAYALLSLLTLLLMFLPPGSYQGIPLNVLASGIFTLVWGVLTLVIAMRWISGGSRAPSAGVPEAFVSDFGISGRESEIVQAVGSGATSREVGQRLFISQRTVEAHLQNVYRKCDVSNRVELMNLLARYREVDTG